MDPLKNPTTYQLTQAQRVMIDQYMDENLGTEAAREVRYIQEKPQIQIEKIKDIDSKARLGVVLGVFTFLGAVACSKIKPDMVKSFGVRLACLTTAAVVGGALGGTSSACVSFIQIKQSRDYSIWKAEKIRQNVFSHFAAFLQEEKLFSEFLCPIKQDLIEIPVKAPDGRVYNLPDIEEWLSKKEKEFPPEKLLKMSEEERREAISTFSPIRTGVYFTKNDLVYDPQYHAKLFQRIKEVFNQGLDEVVREGLLCYRTAALQTQEQIGKHLISQMTEQLQRNQIDAATFAQEVNRITTLMQLAPL